MTMNNTALRTSANKDAPLEGLGSEINKNKNLMRCIYDFAVNGGAISTINLLDDEGNLAILPKGAIVTRCLVYVATAPVGASGTISLDLLTGADLMAATAVASLTLGLLWNGKPVDPAAGAAFTTKVGPVTAVNGTQVTATIATTAFTAGKLIVFLEYYNNNVG